MDTEESADYADETADDTARAAASKPEKAREKTAFSTFAVQMTQVFLNLHGKGVEGCLLASFSSGQLRLNPVVPAEGGAAESA
jgi:hypothetical protein